MSATGRVYVVAQKHSSASDEGAGDERSPFATINRAAELAEPGDTVLVHEGVYRERVNPRRGGLEGRPIRYGAAGGETVCIRGSDVFSPSWQAVSGCDGVYSGALSAVKFGAEAYAGQLDESVNGEFNPYVLNFNRGDWARPRAKALACFEAEVARWQSKVDEPEDDSSGTGKAGFLKKLSAARAELSIVSRDDDPRLMTTLGQVFVDGRPLVEVEFESELKDLHGTWMVSPEGDAILVHFPGSAEPNDCLVEIATRSTVFSPLERGLGYIQVKGFIIEHGANHFPTWGNGAWAQVGLLSCRSGHHWLIEDNTIRYAKGLGVDCGSEGGDEIMENPGGKPNWHGVLAEALESHKPVPNDVPGRHLIRSNQICDNGHCGIAGIGHYGTRVLGNIIERNNRTGYTSPWWEFGGIKFHFFFDGLIEGNLVRDNDAHGIWIDNQWRGSRITRNVIVNNLWSGVLCELGRGPVLIDNNVIAYTRQGDGIYGHDASDVTIAHNLIYANSNFGVWFAYCTNRVKNEDGCWDIRALNNMILGNKVGAVAYPMPWECAGNNVSEGNLLMGGGEYLDEGSGPMPPLFQFTNKTHCGQFSEYCGARVPMDRENTLALFKKLLVENGLPEGDWPNLDMWQDNYLVNLEMWRKIMKSDVESRVISAIKDGLQSRIVSWDMYLDETVRDVKCGPVDGVDKDFRGRPMDASPLPGPFQAVEMGRNHVTLWPVRGVPTELRA